MVSQQIKSFLSHVSKTLLKPLIPIIFFALIISCEDDEKNNSYCDSPTGDVVNEQPRRIYKWQDPSSDRYFYYIGNPDITLKNGGFIPCNGLPLELVPDAETSIPIIYSGTIKLGRVSEEPLYLGIELTSILRED